MGDRDAAKTFPKNASKTVQQQFIELLLIVADFCLLILRIIYYNFETVYRWFVPKTPESVNGEVVLITGAGHGIGRQLALQYACQGATTVLWDINEAGNKETAQMIVQMTDSKPFIYNCDVSVRDQVLATAKEVIEQVGDVTILINNAGIMPAHPLEQHTESEIRRIMDINLLAHFWTIEAFLPAMRRNNRGHIVALSSIAGLTGLTNLAPYCASKFAVRGLMETLHDELNLNPRNNVKTTTVCPFMVDTGLCKKPYVRFEKALNLLEPSHVAKEIMLAQRTGVVECTIPKFLLNLANVTRLFPTKAEEHVKKFFESGVHSDL